MGRLRTLEETAIPVSPPPCAPPPACALAAALAVLSAATAAGIAEDSRAITSLSLPRTAGAMAASASALGAGSTVVSAVSMTSQERYSLVTLAAPTRSVPLRSSAARGTRAVPIWRRDAPSHTSTHTALSCR